MKGLLSRWDWIYLLSLLVPFVAFDLILKASAVASLPGGRGLARLLELMRSDVFFALGYALFWVGLFAVARRGLPRRAVVVLFHTATILVVTVTTVVHQYFRENGTALNYGTIDEWALKFDEIVPILVNDVPLMAWVLLAAALLYATLGPLAVARAVERWRGLPGSPMPGALRLSLMGPLGLWLLAFGFGSLSVLLVGPADGAGSSFARDPFVNVVLTGVKEATAEEYDPATSTMDPPTDTTLAQTTQNIEAQRHPRPPRFDPRPIGNAL